MAMETMVCMLYLHPKGWEGWETGSTTPVVSAP